ncbi:MAG: hypothetical protein JSV80_11745, partial [Acidobacteriota bacterium]
VRALSGEVFATDEVFRRVRLGAPFRQAYREVAEAVQRGEAIPEIDGKQLLRSRRSTGGAGKLGLAKLERRLARLRERNVRHREAFSRALASLTGRADLLGRGAAR